ncbi:hypothetical protein JKP31_22535 [Vibrio vulnificus]|uniref:hypothetical protein n=1 Tax=Vibrio vulnificus TaxID=672 RepID=UPI001CDB4C1D|nr:hypothetical protein [Vibrio vulnificus]MCA3904026.1 hypothetical protein [Vibrio vulnificus]
MGSWGVYDFFDYMDESKRPPLLNKHLLLDSDNEEYVKQLSFDKSLASLLGIDYDQEVMLYRAEFEAGLSEKGKTVKGFRLINV